MPKASQLMCAVQEVLFREWDPIGINHNELCRDEYDSYAPAIVRLLSGGADEFKLSAHLSELRRESMGLGGDRGRVGQHELRIARCLSEHVGRAR